METKSNRTKHALEQMTRRDIPSDYLDYLEGYGESVKCRDGGRKFALGKRSFSLIRKDNGRKAPPSLRKYRNVYAVICNEKVVTVARSKTPLFRKTI